MTEEKMNEMAEYYQREEQTMHPGLAMGLIVIMEDPIIHTDEHPECDDPTCPCHEQEDREELLVRQAAQHLESRGYFDLWGEHSDLDSTRF
jgi:hypothetical protein